MTPPQTPPPRDGAPKTGDERFKVAGLQLVTRLAATMRVGRAYHTDNQVFRQQLERLVAAIGPLLEETGEAVLVALQEDLYFNGVRIPVKTSNFKFHKSVLDEFRRRNIAGIRLQKGIQDKELLTFFRLFLQPDVYKGHDLLKACFTEGIDHLTPVIHASTEAPVDGFEYDAPLQWIDLAFGTDTHDTGSDEEGGVWTGTPAGSGRAGGDSGDGSEIEFGSGGGSGGGGPGSEFGGGSGGGGGGGGSGGGTGSGYGSGTGSGTGGGSGSGDGTGSGGHAPRGAARKNYAQALAAARSLLTTTTLQNGLELRHGKRVVQPLVDGAFAGEPVVVGLTSLTHRDEYTYAHAVNVCLVAVTMGRLLDMDRRALADLGVAALLHDVGKAMVCDEVLHPLESFTDADRAAAERHPLEGAMLLARSTTLNQTTLRCMRVSLEHHMVPDGTGYPAASGRWPQSVMSRLVSVADCYVSLLGNRSDRGAQVTPSDALGMMLGPLRKRFDAAMLWALIQTVGFYPPGQLVMLNDGSVAAVLAPNAADLARPHVRVLLGPAGEPVDQSRPLGYHPLPAHMSVQRALRAEEYPADPEAEAA